MNLTYSRHRAQLAAGDITAMLYDDGNKKKAALRGPHQELKRLE